jgi:hypothetical protein
MEAGERGAGGGVPDFLPRDVMEKSRKRKAGTETFNHKERREHMDKSGKQEAEI